MPANAEERAAATFHLPRSQERLEAAAARLKRMWSMEGPVSCAECERVVHDLMAAAPCVICARFFCRRHIAFRDGLPTCRDCEGTRREIEATSPISDAEVRRVVHVVSADLRRTVGDEHQGIVREASARLRLVVGDAANFEGRVVDEVQQVVHDTFLDTSWPACPDHPNHPLWYSDGWWRCAQTGRAIAPLGELTRNSQGIR